MVMFPVGRVEMWTNEDKKYAWSHGWDVFSLDNGMLQIQALDEPDMVCEDAGIESIKTFEGSYRDFNATGYVYSRAGKHQDPVCLKAIRLVECGYSDACDKLCELEG
jgi:hypothetical protein